MLPCFIKVLLSAAFLSQLICGTSTRVIMSVPRSVERE